MRSLRFIVAAIMVASMSSFVATPAHATVQTDFIAKLVGPAQENQRNTGIPASVAIGMAALESGWGRSTMASTMLINGVTYQVNTLFNIKCTSVVSPYQTGCVPVPSYEYRSDGTKYLLTSNFRTYANWGNSLLDYGRLLTTASRYSEAFKYSAYPDQFIIEVHKAGYATDPKYSELVTSIMKSYNLYQYNTNGAGPGLPGSSPTPTTSPEPTTAGKLPALAYGDRGTSVTSLQHLLNEQGAGLSIDGSYGTRTKDAVSAFQRAVSLPLTGVMDDPTWARLLPRLRQYHTGSAVRALQIELNQSGASLPVTGYFGPQTASAVRAFQTKQGIDADGWVSPLVWSLLYR